MTLPQLPEQIKDSKFTKYNLVDRIAIGALNHLKIFCATFIALLISAIVLGITDAIGYIPETKGMIADVFSGKASTNGIAVFAVLVGLLTIILSAILLTAYSFLKKEKFAEIAKQENIALTIESKELDNLSKDNRFLMCKEVLLFILIHKDDVDIKIERVSHDHLGIKIEKVPHSDYIENFSKLMLSIKPEDKISPMAEDFLRILENTSEIMSIASHLVNSPTYVEGDRFSLKEPELFMKSINKIKDAIKNISLAKDSESVCVAFGEMKTAAISLSSFLKNNFTNKREELKDRVSILNNSTHSFNALLCLQRLASECKQVVHEKATKYRDSTKLAFAQNFQECRRILERKLDRDGVDRLKRFTKNIQDKIQEISSVISEFGWKNLSKDQEASLGTHIQQTISALNKLANLNIDQIQTEEQVLVLLEEFKKAICSLKDSQPQIRKLKDIDLSAIGPEDLISSLSKDIASCSKLQYELNAFIKTLPSIQAALECILNIEVELQKITIDQFPKLIIEKLKEFTHNFEAISKDLGINAETTLNYIRSKINVISQLGSNGVLSRDAMKKLLKEAELAFSDGMDFVDLEFLCGKVSNFWRHFSNDSEFEKQENLCNCHARLRQAGNTIKEILSDNKFTTILIERKAKSSFADRSKDIAKTINDISRYKEVFLFASVNDISTDTSQLDTFKELTDNNTIELIKALKFKNPGVLNIFSNILDAFEAALFVAMRYHESVIESNRQDICGNILFFNKLADYVEKIKNEFTSFKTTFSSGNFSETKILNFCDVIRLSIDPIINNKYIYNSLTTELNEATNAETLHKLRRVETICQKLAFPRDSLLDYCSNYCQLLYLESQTKNCIELFTNENSNSSDLTWLVKFLKPCNEELYEKILSVINEAFSLGKNSQDNDDLPKVVSILKSHNKESYEKFSSMLSKASEAAQLLSHVGGDFKGDTSNFYNEVKRLASLLNTLTSAGTSSECNDFCEVILDVTNTISKLVNEAEKKISELESEKEPGTPKHSLIVKLIATSKELKELVENEECSWVNDIGANLLKWIKVTDTLRSYAISFEQMRSSSDYFVDLKDTFKAASEQRGFMGCLLEMFNRVKTELSSRRSANEDDVEYIKENIEKFSKILFFFSQPAEVFHPETEELSNELTIKNLFQKMQKVLLEIDEENNKDHDLLLSKMADLNTSKWTACEWSRETEHFKGYKEKKRAAIMEVFGSNEFFDLTLNQINSAQKQEFTSLPLTNVRHSSSSQITSSASKVTKK